MTTHTSNTQIGLFYGSTTGNTENVARQLAAAWGEGLSLHDIASDGVSAMPDYNPLILGIPTWDFGELQEDWQDLWETLQTLDFTGKTIALFGLGDQIGYGDWFLDAMGLLHELLIERGARCVGYWPVEGYSFDASKALTADGRHFVGLALDEDSQAGETPERISAWVEQLKGEMSSES